METVNQKKLYEGMFLVDSALASANWDGIIEAIKTILERAEAEIVSLRKWDERKLAYEVKGISRGIYILAYFRADGNKIRDIEKSVKLSEQIMRVLILNFERMAAEEIEKETPAAKAEKLSTQQQTEEVRETEETEQTQQDEETKVESVQETADSEQDISIDN